MGLKPGNNDAKRVQAEAMGVAILVIVTALAYTAVGIFKHWHFDTNYDLGIFDQAVWHMSRFETPASTISGYSNILGDHFYPILFLLALPYWLVPAAETLIVAQAVLVALSIIPVFVFLRRRLVASLCFGLATAYALFWGLQRAIASDFHEMAFAPLVIACVVLAIDSRRWLMLWASCLVLIGIKEDLVPLVAASGAYVYLQGARRQGLALMVFGVTAFVAIVGFVIPWFGDGWSSGGAYRDVWEKPWTAPFVLFTPPEKVTTVVFWLAPFCFLPLASPFALLALPIAMERLLSSLSTHWGWGGHYSAPLAPLLAMSAGDGLRRLMNRPGSIVGRSTRFPAGIVALSVCLALVVPGHQPLLRLFARRHYSIAVGHGPAASALARIPASASVVAQSALLPHLSQRQSIHLFDEDAPEADYVVAASGLNAWPLSSQEDLARLVDERRRRGYVTVFDESGWVVLKSPMAVE